MLENVKNFTLHIHITDSVDEERIMQKLSDIETNLGAQIMAQVDEVLSAIAAEKAEVAAAVDGLTAQITALQEQIAAGGAVTPEQLDQIKIAIGDIFTAPVTP